MSSKPGEIRDSDMLSESLTFLGKVMASVSHELNNVISIIDQTGGLLQDLVIGEEKGIPISIQRLSQAASSVRNQTKRGLDIIQRLNRFAHSTDLPITKFDVNEVMENIVALTQRLAGLKRARLEFKPYSTGLSVHSNPFLLQQIIFNLIIGVLASVEPDDRVEIAVNSVEAGSSISVGLSRRIELDHTVVEKIRKVVGGIQGQLDYKQDETRSEFCLTVPDWRAGID